MMRSLAIAIGCLALAQTSVFSQESATAYPAGPVRVIVPFAAGGANDLLARTIAQRLNEAWKQPIVVENKPGANAMLGADAVAKSAPDGHTFLVAAIAHAVNVSLFPNAPYQFERDLRAVAMLSFIPLVPVVAANSPIRSLHDLVAASKRQALNAGSSGNGTATHLALELFKNASGAAIQHVAYKGGAPAMSDLLGGRLDVMFAVLPECLPLIRAGKLRPLAVTSGKRHPLLPDVPTTAEAGIAGVEVASWNGVMVPAGTPREIVSKINAEIVRIVSRPEMRERIIELGYEPAAMGVAEAERFIKSDIERWAKVIRTASITAD
jgi:tripartite-type tricarboxylate transporter receptor subunit TctC